MKYKWISAARFALREAPIPEIMAVTQVPIFCPMIMGTAAPKLTAPVMHSACKIPTDAEEDWITAVRMSPASTPNTGFWNLISRLVNSGTSASGETAALMESMPNIRIAKPTRMVAAFFNLSLWENSKIPTPTIARIGEKELGLSIRIQKASLSMPVRLKIQEVTVVPILAPMMMPTACFRLIMPELTKPTTITVVAEEDWITPVTTAPINTALIGLLVSFSRIRSRRPPDAWDNPSPNRFIPYKNSASPPTIFSKSKKSIL